MKEGRGISRRGRSRFQGGSTVLHEQQAFCDICTYGAVTAAALMVHIIGQKEACQQENGRHEKNKKPDTNLFSGLHYGSLLSLKL